MVDLHDTVEEDKAVDKGDDILEEENYLMLEVFCRILRFSEGGVGILFEVEHIVISFVDGKQC